MFGLRLLGHVSKKIAHETNELLACDPSRCLRMRYSGSSCDRCSTVCRSRAIDLSDGLQLDRGACSGCLACSTVCPSGALEADVSCHQLFNLLAAHHQETFVLGCSRTTGPAHHRLPCLGMLSLEHLLVLAGRTACRLQLDCTGCRDCNANGMLSLLSATLQRVVALQTPSHPVELIEAPELLDYRVEQLDRRGFFSSFRTLASQGAQAVLAEDEPAAERHAYGDKVLPRRHRLLLEHRQRLSPAAATACSHQITFTDACTACMACVQACPTGALVKSAPQDDTAIPPRFNAEHCTGCGLCVEFCLDAAVFLKRDHRTHTTAPK